MIIIIIISQSLKQKNYLPVILVWLNKMRHSSDPGVGYFSCSQNMLTNDEI